MKKFVFLLLEILILTVIVGTIAVVIAKNYHAHFQSMPTYTVVFKDVDSLSIGSPVRLMGKNIGHIVKLELSDSQIYATFRITEPDVDLPDNAYASIQFTGLAGFRSLEIMPLKGKINGKRFLSVEPIRINSMIEVQTTIFQNILDFCRDVYAFFDNQGAKNTEETVKKTSKYIKETNQTMDEAITVIKNSGNNISKRTKEIHGFLEEQNKNYNNTYQSVKTLSSKQNFKINLEQVQNSVEKVAVPLDVEKIDSNLSKFSKNVNSLNKNVENLNKKIYFIKENKNPSSTKNKTVSEN